MRRLRRLPLRAIGALAGVVYRNHNLIFVLIALVSTAGLAVASGYWLFYRATYVLTGLIPLCYVWARLHIRGLDVDVERSEDRLQVGQQAEARVRLKSRSAFTKLWLEVADETDMPGRPPRTVITLPARASRNWKIVMRCARRGVFSAGPVTVTTGDPFGLFKFRRTFGQKQSLIVLPQPEELPYFWAPAAQLPGEGTVHKRTHYVTPNASAVREYYPGDSYGRIHWRSTARLGRLMVKTFEMDPTSNVWIVLDLHGACQAGAGDQSTEEYGVRIAASLAYHFLQTNRMLGLMAVGGEKVVLDPARGAQQYQRILEGLALAQATGQDTLATVLAEEGRKLSRHTTAIIITPSTDPDWISALQSLVHQGARAAAILLDAESFGAPLAEASAVAALSATGVPAYLVPAGSDLSLVLGPGGMVGGDTGGQRQPAGVR